MAFRVGQKVVCINNAPVWGSQSDMDGLTVGHIYTIREIARHRTTGHLGARLVEIHRSLRPFEEEEAPFVLSRFRPVVERKTDISALQALLVPGSKIKETV